ncbi:hypothetical protein L873DRAFT_1802409 [Choiromyces venosus 120613-1]|uniref:Uncharacterized protein n=1 Tax=Choiromyces venosus 120613-1 TaxID=1336337 RepID=A0A3N4JVS3_9PEZI|nr:hypothetical protein L873DRAFT_1802409 [Choiromyces venosus 120613-1]
MLDRFVDNDSMPLSLAILDKGKNHHRWSTVLSLSLRNVSVSAVQSEGLYSMSTRVSGHAY